MLATVGVPPMTETAPPLTRIVPAASRLTVMLLSRLSPLTLSTPLLNDAVTAACAVAAVAAAKLAATAAPVDSRRAARFGVAFMNLLLGGLGSRPVNAAPHGGIPEYDSRVGTEPLDNAMRIGAAAAALGVSVDTLRRWERDGRVEFERRGNQRYMPPGRSRGCCASARAPATRAPATGSAASCSPVKRDGVMAQVELACGPYRVVSLMSREAADELGLEPGSRAEAVIKATGVVIETR